MQPRGIEADTLVEVLQRYGHIRPRLTRLDNGLINHTWLVDACGEKYILQRVNPMFGAEIHQDITAVTSHLSQKGVLVPQLIPADDGHAYVSHAGTIWRLYNYLEGDTFNTAVSPAVAFEAGHTLARFHQGLLDLDYRFKNRRSGVHDTRQHIQILQTSLETHQDHPRFGEVLPLATEILTTIRHLPDLPDFDARKVHGDPKINNFLFEKGSGKGLSMLDFDTLGEMPLVLELGDAMRSWCNPAGENTRETCFSIENFSAGLEGYASHAREFITPAEWGTIILATQMIYLELATRFCADALNQSFFNWDDKKFSSHSEHNQVRAQGQLNAFKSLKQQCSEAERILNDIFVADCSTNKPIS